MLGIVKWFNNEKGFGFLTSSDGQDIFVHYKAIVMDGHKRLDNGQKVSFDCVVGTKGMSAKEVRLV